LQEKEPRKKALNSQPQLSPIANRAGRSETEPQKFDINSSIYSSTQNSPPPQRKMKNNFEGSPIEHQINELKKAKRMQHIECKEYLAQRKEEGARVYLSNKHQIMSIPPQVLG